MYHQAGLMRDVSFGTMQIDIDFGSLKLNFNVRYEVLSVIHFDE